jgi:hypothetical protein
VLRRAAAGVPARPRARAVDRDLARRAARGALHHDPLEFSSFPALLLILTLFRLALNVRARGSSSARGEAGDVIEAFGQFVIGGNYAVGSCSS